MEAGARGARGTDSCTSSKYRRPSPRTPTDTATASNDTLRHWACPDTEGSIQGASAEPRSHYTLVRARDGKTPPHSYSRNRSSTSEERTPIRKHRRQPSAEGEKEGGHRQRKGYGETHDRTRKIAISGPQEADSSPRQSSRGHHRRTATAPAPRGQRQTRIDQEAISSSLEPGAILIAPAIVAGRNLYRRMRSSTRRITSLDREQATIPDREAAEGPRTRPEHGTAKSLGARPANPLAGPRRIVRSIQDDSRRSSMNTQPNDKPITKTRARRQGVTMKATATAKEKRRHRILAVYVAKTH